MPSPPPAVPADYFTSHRARTSRPPATVLGAQHRTPAAALPGSPRTPLLSRSISSQFGTPGSFRTEQEEQIVYELGARHLSAGFAGEGRARCVVKFGPEGGRRVGDYRQYEPKSDSVRKSGKEKRDEERWGREYELYTTNTRTLDMGLVEAKLERAVRNIHTTYLQLDQKPRKVVLAIPSLLPTPLLELALKVLFSHYTQPPSVTILTNPMLTTVSAGLRNALVVDVGWEETVVTAVGEYKEIFQRRSIRAGKMLVLEMAKIVDTEVEKASGAKDANVGFRYVEDITQRLAWCRPRTTSIDETDKAESEEQKRIPSPDKDTPALLIPFTTLSNPAETALFAASIPATEADDHDLPLHSLAYRVLLALPIDLRTTCLSRIVVTGGVCQLPGLKHRLLQEIQHLVTTKGWDPVRSYGSASAHHSRVLQERSANVAARKQKAANTVESEQSLPGQPQSKAMPTADLPAHSRPHDDTNDPISIRAERHTPASKQQKKPKDTANEARGVNSLGAWAGASLLASLRIKGAEVEREEFMRHGLRAGGTAY